MWLKKMKLKKNQKMYLLAFSLIAMFLMFILFGSLLGWWAVTPTETPTTQANSTFTLIDYTSGEDVSDFVEISVWTPDEGEDFAESKDIYRITSYDEEIESDDADDVSIDLRDDEYAFVEIDPDGEQVFSNDFHLLTGGANYDYTIYVYHLSSNVTMTNINRDNGCVAALYNSSAVDGYFINTTYTCAFQGTGNYTMVLDVPFWTTTTTQLHAGDNWDIDDTEIVDMSEDELRVLYSERNWRCQTPLYNPSVDTSKEYDTTLEKLTNAFAVRFTMNASINCTDGAAAQVNMSIRTEVFSDPIVIVTCGQYIYHIFYEPIDFDPKVYTYDYEVSFGSDIVWTDIESGRLTIPKGSDACPIGSYDTYMSICQCKANSSHWCGDWL